MTPHPAVIGELFFGKDPATSPSPHPHFQTHSA